jgi:hypothetical protein
MFRFRTSRQHLNTTRRVSRTAWILQKAVGTSGGEFGAGAVAAHTVYGGTMIRACFVPFEFTLRFRKDAFVSALGIADF